MIARSSVRVAALYCFTRFEDPSSLRDALLDRCISEGVYGTLLLAHEGINGTIAGSDEGIEQVLNLVRALPGCMDIEVKDSWTQTLPFKRMKVRLKREIVTMGEPDIDPLSGVGHYVSPEDWNTLIRDPDTILIDTRNHYEVEFGTFRGAIDPQTSHFRDFPAWFRDNRKRLLSGRVAPKIAMFCTGGIRCEKATAFVKSEGIGEVYHLKGGILNYLERIPAEESRWDGECFVFDERVSVTYGVVKSEDVQSEHDGRQADAGLLPVKDGEAPQR